MDTNMNKQTQLKSKVDWPKRSDIDILQRLANGERPSKLTPYTVSYVNNRVAWLRKKYGAKTTIQLMVMMTSRNIISESVQLSKEEAAWQQP
jgi:hypothetical protein